MPPESPEPGRWRSARTPFWHPIYQAAQDPRPRQIVVVMGAQMGKTESILNMIGQRMTDGPFMPALIVEPTEKSARSLSRDRLDQMLRSTPVLYERTAKGQRWGTFEKWISGVRVGMAWAGSATELASHPCGLVFVDERDRMSSDVADEGDPVSLARARTKNYPLGKVFVFSTPTVDGASPIWSLFLIGTMEKWAWHCVDCGALFVPRLELLRWPKGATPAEALKAARVECEHCRFPHEERHKVELNEGGRYLAHRLEADGKHVPLEAPAESTTWSYWASGLASPWASFGQIAAVLIEAYRTRDQEKIQAEINTWGGEVYRVKGDAPEWAEVAARRREYSRGQVPAGVQLITLGADVQKRGIYYVVRGWGHNLESWLIEQDYLAGETEFDNVWIALSRVLVGRFGDRYIDRGFVDSGFRPGDRERRPDHAVYTWARRHPGHAFPTKGHAEQDSPIKLSPIDVSVGGLLVRNGVMLGHVNTDFFKRWVHARVKWPEDQAGGWHLYRDATEDYCRQIVSEELILLPSGRGRWVKRAADNHYLDAEVNATAAAWSINAFRLPTWDQYLAENTAVSDPGGSPDTAGDPYSRREL